MGVGPAAGLLEATLEPALCPAFEPPARRADPVDPASTPAWPAPDRPYVLRWCAAATDVRSALPALWSQVALRVDPGGDDCVDLVVDVDVLGRLVGVDVGPMPLTQVLVALGDPDGAAAAAQAVGQPAEVAGPAVADLLERLWLLGAG